MEKALIQAKLPYSAFGDIGKIKGLTGINNRTLILVMALDISTHIIEELKKGNEIIIKEKNGNQQKLKIVGI